MKTKKSYSLKYLFAWALAALLSGSLSSCSSTKIATVDMDYVAKNGFVMAKPIVVDVKVEKRKIEGKAVIKNDLYSKETVIVAAKNLAVIDAVKRGDADIIVQPVFQIESAGSYTTATVTGFAGKYKEFRDVTADDAIAFKIRRRMQYSSITESAVPGEISVTKSGRK